MDKDLQEMMAHPFAVLTGRTPAVGASATYSAAYEQMRNQTGKYFAETGHVQMGVTKEQMEALIKAGAADAEHVQVFRYSADANAEQSHQCECNRWVHSVKGEQEQEHACFCGRKHRNVYDFLDGPEPPVMGIHCMDCGAAYTGPFATKGRGDWKRVNYHQMRCGVCRKKGGED